jgi:ABC-type spermidine/putrescine transport system permease subunit II
MTRRLRALLRSGARSLYGLLLLVLVLLMLLPNVVVFLLSFSGESFIRFPPESWGLRQYETFFGSSQWLDPLRRSLVLGTVVATVSVLIGGIGVIAFARSQLPGRNLIHMVALGPMLVPGIGYAIAVYALFSRLGLTDTFAGLVVAHTVMAVPYVILIVGSAISRVSQDLELVAMSLGASRWRAYWDVTIPILLPAFLASSIFAFITSFDEVVLASFLSGTSFLTLPKAIFDSIRYGVDAVITAIATILTVATALLLWLATALRRRVT